MSTVPLVAISHCLILISLTLPTLLFPPGAAFVFRCGIAVALHFLAYWALALAAAAAAAVASEEVDEGINNNSRLENQKTIRSRNARQDLVLQDTTSPVVVISEYEKRTGAREIAPDVRRIGSLAAGFTVVLPYLVPKEGDAALVVEVLLRIVGFFSACKVVDLVVLRAGRRAPPRLVVVAVRRVDGMGGTGGGGEEKKSDENKEKEMVDMRSWKRKVEYVIRILTEARYFSFDIAIDDQTKRKLWRERHSKRYERFWIWGPRVVVPIATYFFPVPELLILQVLVLVNLVLEVEHYILHPFCAKPMFLAPFAASGIGEFWAVHWHQDAQSWLISLGYRPSKWFAMEILRCSKIVGSAAGVMGTFALSGLWHAWCAAVLSERPWLAGTGMFLVFISQGVGCLFERMVWKEDDAGWVKRVICWAFSIECGALWVRCMLPTLKKEVLRMGPQ
ncbi:hypothetical protein BST61_g2642 [Cercospora zeina]